MTLTKNQKKDIISKVKDAFTDVPLIILSDFQGLNMQRINELRSNLRKINATFKVFKNRLAHRALNQLNISNLDTEIHQPTGFIYGGEPSEMSKTVTQFIKNNDKLSIKSGIFENSQITKDVIEQLAKLPSREVLIAQFIGFTKAPTSNLVRVLSSPITKLTLILKAIQEQKSIQK